MKVNEIADLIQIRNYLSESINNFSISRAGVNELNRTLVLLDKVLVKELTGEKFRERVSFGENVDEALQEVIEVRKIK